jgi:Na+/proline symporter
MQKKDHKEVSLRELRQVGCGFGILFCLVGGILFWKDHRWGALLLLVGPLLTLAFWFELPGVRPFFKIWMAFAMRMSRVMTAVLLSLLYFLVLTPTSLLARLFGQRFVETKIDKAQPSYWEPRSGRDDPKRSEKQS